MKGNTTTDRAVIAVLSLSLFSLILLSSLNNTISDKRFYESEFEKLGVYNRFGKSVADAEAQNLIAYFDNKDPIIGPGFFNEKERQHLIDVKNLISLSKTLLLISSAILVMTVIFAVLKKKDLFYLLSRASMASGFISFTLIILAFLLQAHFSSVFYDFHLLFFQNDLWLLDPATDNLINLFPQRFFFDAVADMVQKTAIFSSLFFIEGMIFIYLSREARPRP